MRALKILLLASITLLLIFSVSAYIPCDDAELKAYNDDMGFKIKSNYHVQLDYMDDEYVNLAEDEVDSTYVGYNKGTGVRYSLTYQFDETTTVGCCKESKPINVKYMGYNPGLGGHYQLDTLYDELIPIKKYPCPDYKYPDTATVPSYQGW